MLYCVVLSLLRDVNLRKRNKFYTRKNKQTVEIYARIYAERNLSDNGCHKIRKKKID